MRIVNDKLWQGLCGFLCLGSLLLQGEGSQSEPASSNAPPTGQRLAPVVGDLLLRSQVVIAGDPAATVSFLPMPDRLPRMLERGLTRLTGRTTTADAWLSLVSTQDVVGLKVFTAPGPTVGTRPAVVETVVRSLLEAGLPAEHIWVWDKRLADLRKAGYFQLAERYGIRVAGSAEAGYDEDVFYESSLIGRLVWGDYEFGSKEPAAGRKSFVSRLVTKQLTRIITIAPLLNHNLGGVSGNLIGLTLGSVDNTLRFEGSAERLAEAVPELAALDAFYNRWVLGIVDALICQYQGEGRPLLHYSHPLNELWFSRDPVALDVLAVEELERQRVAARIPGRKPSYDLYRNAELLELGVAEVSAIGVIRLNVEDPTETRPNP